MTVSELRHLIDHRAVDLLTVEVDGAIVVGAVVERHPDNTPFLKLQTKPKS